MALTIVHIAAVAHLNGGLSVFWSNNHEDRDADFTSHEEEWNELFPHRKGFMPAGKMDLMLPEEWTPARIREEIDAQVRKGLDYTSSMREQIMNLVMGKTDRQPAFPTNLSQFSLMVATLSQMAASETFVHRAIAEDEQDDGVSVVFAELSMGDEGCGDPHCPYCQGKRTMTRH